MKKNKDTLIKMLSLGLALSVPFALSAQDIPEDPPPPPPVDLPEDPPPPPEDVPEDPPPPLPDDLPDGEEPELPEEDGPPQRIVDFLELRSEFLEVVKGTYESGEARAQAITDWLAENGPAIDELEDAQEAANIAGESIELPDEAVVGERPEASQNMVDLEALLEDKLYAVANDNEALKQALETAELDRQARLDALMEARDARLAEVDAAREAAKAKRDEARENSQGDRRSDEDLDDLPGGG